MSILLLTMGPQLSISMVATDLNIGSPGTIVLRAVGAAGSVTWTLLSSSLPTPEWGGLVSSGSTATLNAANVLTPGAFTIRVRVVDSFRQPVEAEFTVRVQSLPITITGSLSEWIPGQPVSDSLSVSGGSGVYVGLAVIGGGLPAGVSASIVGSTVVFSGSPVGVGSGSVALQVTDSNGDTGTGEFAWSATWPEFMQLSGSGSIYVPAGQYDVLVVAGGGGGGSRQGGGGGAGGVIYLANESLSGPISYAVGNGGAGGTSGGRGANGQDTTFGVWTSVGGGGGGGRTTDHAGADGGSGGGSSSDGVTIFQPGAGTSGQGHKGGRHSWPEYNKAGGGGGAGDAGSDAVPPTQAPFQGDAGPGGVGRYIPGFDAYGDDGWFGGGGGGGGFDTLSVDGGGAGGKGGGGKGDGRGRDSPPTPPNPGQPGIDGTGGGGGGSGSGVDPGGAGGTGTIIIKRRA